MKHLFGQGTLLSFLLTVCLGVTGAPLAFAQQSALPRVMTSTGHSGKVTGLQFSSDGRVLFSIADDQTLKIWDPASGNLLRTLKRPPERQTASLQNSIAVLNNGKQVAWMYRDGQTIHLFDAQSGEIERTVKFDGTQLFAKRDGTLLARYSGGYSIIDLANEKVRSTVRFARRDVTMLPRTVALSSDERVIASAENDFTPRLKGWIELLDADSGRLLRSLDRQDGYVKAMAFSPDGKLLASGGEDKIVRIWEVSSGQLLHSIRGHEYDIASIAFSPDGQRLVSAGLETILISDPVAGGIIEKIGRNNTFDPGAPIAVSPDGKTFASSSGYSHRIGIWDLSGRFLREMQGGGQYPPLEVRSGSDSTFYVSDEHGLELWSLTTGFLRDRLPGNHKLLTDGDFRPALARRAVAFNSYQSGGFIETWDGETVSRVPGASLGYSSGQVRLSPDGMRFAEVKEEKEKQYAILLHPSSDASLTQRIALAKYHSLSKLAFANKSQSIALIGMEAANKYRLTLWSSDTGNQLWSVRTGDGDLYKPSFGIDSLVFSPNDQMIVGIGRAGEDRGLNLQVFSAIDGRSLWKANHGVRIAGAAFSPDSSRLVTVSGQDDTVRLWDTKSGKMIRDIAGNAGTANSVVFSSDARRLIVGNVNQTLTVWDTESGELLVTSIRSRNGDWLTVTPEGFFAASENGASLAYVTAGFEAIGIDRVYQVLYRPDLVREKLAGDPRRLVREAASRLNLAKVIATGNAPDVRLTLPGRALGPASIDGNSVSAEAEITDRGGGVGRIEWRINGVTAGIDAPGSGSTSPLRLSRRIQLEPGANAIEVVAYNSANAIASAPARLTVTQRGASSIVPTAPIPGQGGTPPPAMPSAAAAKPRLFVLVAGVNDYADKRIKLTYAVSDAKEVARAFREASGNLYQSVEVKLMTDREVIRQGLDAAFADMAGKATASDIFVVYLAGHGKTVDGRYHFIPQDLIVEGELNDASINTAVRAKAIAQDQWQRWFASIPARKSVIFFDTCDSGTLAGDETQELERTAANDRLSQATGRSILAASGGREEAIEGYRGHGLFTYQVLDAINRSDGDNSGTVELNELAAYVYGQVSEVSQKVFKQRQVPQMKITSNYPLAKPTRILMDEVIPVAEVKPTVQLAKTASVQVQPGSGATVVRSLDAKTSVTVLETRNGWSLVASEGRPLGYVATRDLAPAH